MKNYFITILFIFAILLMNCEPESSPSVYDADDAGAPTPVITTITPADSIYGGVGTKQIVTINGENFNPVKEKNLVYFGKEQGDVIEVSSTQLKVAAPANYSDSLLVQVHAHGAYLPGKYGAGSGSEFEMHPYKLLSPSSQPGGFIHGDNPSAICVDAENNLFVANGNDGKKLDKVTTTGLRMYYGNFVQSPTKIIIGPNGAIYYNYLSYILKTDSTAFAPDEESPDSEYGEMSSKVKDFTFDENKNFYAICANSIDIVNYVDLSILSQNEFSDDTLFTTGRIFGGELYLIGSYGGVDTTLSAGPYLWKQGIDAGNATLTGELQEVINFSEAGYKSIEITSIDFNQDGGIYIGTRTNSLLYSSDPASGSFSQVYPQILGDHIIFNFKWSEDDYIYINTKNIDDNTKTTILKIKLFENGAIHYGRHQ